MKNLNIAILGSVGVPANYGGFETLAENLVIFHESAQLTSRLTVFCSGKGYQEHPTFFRTARLIYIPIYANGIQSVLYDVVSLLFAVANRNGAILLLGVSGAIALPFIRLISKSTIITNIDGIEWRRDKWRGVARWFLRLSERMAVRFSHHVVADNGGIADYVTETYGLPCEVIAYGGDHAITAVAKPYTGQNLPAAYAFALCRIEPENNVGMILEAFALQSEMPLVFVGNWNNSEYGRALRARFGILSHIHLLDPIYDLGILRYLRGNAVLYVHGHSAGGTNPSLVEMMHFGVPVLAFDCVFNRYTTDGKAIYFASVEQLAARIRGLDTTEASQTGAEMVRIARERYTWDAIGTAYFDLLAH